MKKLGIVTVCKTYNFGAELQAFALQRKLADLGYDAEVINYLYYKNSRHIPSKASKPLTNFPKSYKIKAYFLYHIFTPFIYETILPLFSGNLKRKLKRFVDFHRKHTQFSKEYRSFQQLYDANLPYDVVIAGSDQLWNPATGTSLKPYFLTFAKGKMKKISYASSFGVAEIQPEYQNIYRELLSNLDEIGVRETQGVAMVKQLLPDKTVTQVLDPTLLLTKENWMKVVNTTESYNYPPSYILIYQLSTSNGIVNQARVLSNETGLPVLRICKRPLMAEKDEGITNVLDAGPAEYIHLFLNAALVLTNSFHGTAFSVNFEIPFYTILSKKKKNNSRLSSFLRLVNLEQQLIFEESIVDKQLGMPQIDFVEARATLLDEKKKSLEYLTKAIDHD